MFEKFERFVLLFFVLIFSSILLLLIDEKLEDGENVFNFFEQPVKPAAISAENLLILGILSANEGLDRRNAQRETWLANLELEM